MENTENKANIKARIDRHLRIVRKTGGLNSNLINDNRFGYSIKFVFLFIVLIFPVYPSLASFVYNNSDYDFYRGYIDESSIIESYYGGDSADSSDYGTLIIESEDTFLSVNTILNDNRNLAGTNEIVSYEVKPGESFSSISNSFNVSINSILRANNFDMNHVLKPGEMIRVPPVSGVLHKVVSGDTISSIAKKYDIGESIIKTQNSIDESNTIRLGQTLVIPGAVPVVKPVNKTPTQISTSSKPSSTSNTSGNSGGGYNFGNDGSTITSDRGSYQLVRRQPQWRFTWGNCTRYVAQYKNVNWGGNANQWIPNAKANGIPTGKSPQVGAIISFSGSGYNPRYGHVGIVMEVYDSYMIISDMNYRRLNEITYRKVNINDRSIVGYIYVD